VTIRVALEAAVENVIKSKRHQVKTSPSQNVTKSNVTKSKRHQGNCQNVTKYVIAILKGMSSQRMSNKLFFSSKMLLLGLGDFGSIRKLTTSIGTKGPFIL
jgi:hypothetical protein